jgi:formate hydrogenlyase transcriptional activator
LRARRDDIPILAEHFMQRMGRKLGKPLDRIAPETLEKLTAHSWPGNIRDLQNTIERAAVLSSGATLVVDWELGPKPEATNGSHHNGAAHARVDPSAAAAVGHNGTAPLDGPASRADSDQSLEAIERNHIIGILRQTRGVIEGPRGAARLLEMKPSTVRFRMKRLGISKIDYLA